MKSKKKMFIFTQTYHSDVTEPSQNTTSIHPSIYLSRQLRTKGLRARSQMNREVQKTMSRR